MPNSIDSSSLKEGMLFKKYDASKHYSKVSSRSLQSSDFSWVASLTAALASHTSYLNEADIDVIVKEKWAFEKSKFFAVDNIECFAAKTGRMALIAFRGTELSIADWITDFSVSSSPTNYGRLHSGFLDAFQKVDAELRSVLEDWNINEIVLTGHSLGGAIAMITATEWIGWAEDQNITVKSIYTYGQPAVGKRGFAEYFDSNFKDRCFRIVNGDDVVTKLPPGYDHAGKAINIDTTEKLTQNNKMLTELEFDRLKERLLNKCVLGANESQKEIFGLPSFSDHKITNYIEGIAEKN